MENQIYIPKKLKVGYQKRLDTYSKKLAYVIYYDDKNKLRKETSWKGWIDEKIGIDDFENIPTEGFVLNRNVGGVKNSYGSWSSDIRIEKVRVYDPRGFEFEIDVPNVLAILQECTSTKGKGLEGTFVYGWKGTSLVLIPTISEDYKKAVIFTNIQEKSVNTKELIPGASYKTKKLKDLVYLGRFDWFVEKYSSYSYELVGSKKHIFADLNPFEDEILDINDFEDEEDYNQELIALEEERKEGIDNGTDIEFITVSNLSTIAICNSETPVSNYAELLERFSKSKHAAMPVEFIEEKATPKPQVVDKNGWVENKDKKDYFLKNKDGYLTVSIDVNDKWNNKRNKTEEKFVLDYNYKLVIENNKFVKKYITSEISDSRKDKKYTSEEIKNLGLIRLKVRLSNNKIANIEQYI